MVGVVHDDLVSRSVQKCGLDVCGKRENIQGDQWEEEGRGGEGRGGEGRGGEGRGGEVGGEGRGGEGKGRGEERRGEERRGEERKGEEERRGEERRGIGEEEEKQPSSICAPFLPGQSILS